MVLRKILIRLPSPLGDAILATPALRAIRKQYPDAEITFLANRSVRQVLSPSGFCDKWMELEGEFFRQAFKLRCRNFTDAVIFKNSFGSALEVFLAGVKRRVGYARQGRGFLLTDKIRPLRDEDGSFKPAPMVDYYLKLAESIGCDTSDRTVELTVSEEELGDLDSDLGRYLDSERPLAVLVPGGANGPSKCWQAERFGKTARELKEKYGANVLVSVAPCQPEMETAESICSIAEGAAVNLGEYGLSLGKLKAVFSKADLVITNDTGPRHIAIALGKKVITMFGPNNPEWTQTGYKDEIQIVGEAECVPCTRPECYRERHFCMESITVDKVMSAVEKMIGER